MLGLVVRHGGAGLSLENQFSSILSPSSKLTPKHTALMSDISGAEKRRREVALQKKQHFQANAKRIAKYRRLRNHFEKSEEAKGSAMYKKVREGEVSKVPHPPPWS